MLRTVLHIATGMALVSPAVALTPMPPCSGAAVWDGFSVWNSNDASKGYVTYRGINEARKQAVVVLEHCKTGRSVIAQADLAADDADASHVDNVSDAMDDFVYTSTAYTLRQIVGGLKARGVSARLETLKTESCGCAAYYPDQRGERTPYR